MARLRRDADDETGRRDAIPYHEAPGDLLGGMEGDNRARLLRRLIDEGRDLPSDVHRELGNLFWSLTIVGARHDDIEEELLATHATHIQAGLDVLRAAATSDDAPIDLLEDILVEMPWQLGLAKLDVIATMLEDGESRSIETAERLERGVLGAVIYGGLHGRTMGEESPRVHRTREAALAARDAVTPGSQAWKLCSDLVKWAEHEAAEDRREDEETDWR